MRESPHEKTDHDEEIDHLSRITFDIENEEVGDTSRRSDDDDSRRYEVDQ